MKARALFNYEYRVGQSLWDYQANLLEKIEELHALDTKFPIPRRLIISLFLSQAVNDPVLQKEVLDINRKYLPGKKRTKNLTFERVEAKLQEHQVTHDTMLTKPSGGGRTTAYFSNDEVCNYFREGKECPFGDKCRFKHGKADRVVNKPTQKTSGKPSPSKFKKPSGGQCFACGKTGHRAANCKASADVKKKFRAQVNLAAMPMEEEDPSGRRADARLATVRPKTAQAHLSEATAKLVQRNGKTYYRSYADTGASCHITSNAENVTHNPKTVEVQIDGFDGKNGARCTRAGDIQTR